jgi:hypothetical protein
MKSVLALVAALILFGQSTGLGASPGNVVTVNASSSPAQPTVAYVGDIVQLSIPSTNVTSVSSTVTGTAVTGGAIAYDPASNNIYGYYAVSGLGTATIRFTFSANGTTTTTVVVVEVSVPGAGLLIQLGGQTGPFNVQAIVGDVLRISIPTTGVTTWDSGVISGTAVTLIGKVTEGNTFAAYYAVTSPGTASISFSSQGIGAIFNVTATARR